MAASYDLNVQCFVKRNPVSLFSAENDPRLLYVSYMRPVTNAHPRILHSHPDHLELLLICGGSSEFWIHDRKYEVREGDLVIYNAGIVHDDLTGPETGITYYCMAVGDLRMPGLRENTIVPDDGGCVFPAGSRFESMEKICGLMFHSLSREEQGVENYCTSLMHAFLQQAVMVIRESSGITEVPVDADDILGTRIREYIDSHYMEPLSLQSIGEALNISPYYISHVFKDMSGYSPIQYILRRRIGEAQSLLIMTDLPIAEIAGKVGFDTQNYFNAQFTKLVGIPPKKYRENYVVREEKNGRGKKQ